MLFYRRRKFYKVTRIIAMFIIGLVVALFVALSQVNLETLRGNLVDGLREATGMKVEINGKISWKFSLRPRLELNDVTVPFKSEDKDGNSFVAKKIDVTVNLFSIFRNDPTINKIKIYDAVLSLEKQNEPETDEKVKKNNGTLPKTTDELISKPASKYPFNFDFGLDSIEFRNFKINTVKTNYVLDGFYISSNSSDDTMEYSGWLKSDKSIYPFIVRFSEYNAERKVYPVRAALSVDSKPLVANIALEGRSKMPIDFILKGSVPNIKLIGNIFGINLPETSSLDVNLIGGFGQKTFTLRKSTIGINSDVTSISGDIDWSNPVTKINAKIKSEHISLNELFPKMYTSSTNVKWIRPERELNVFKNTPLFGNELKKLNLNLDLNIKKLSIYRDMSVQDISVQTILKNGQAQFNLKSKYSSGDVSVALDIKTDENDKMFVKAAGLGERIYVGEILEQIHDYGSLSELPSNFEFYFEANGYDLTGLMSTVTGPFYAYSVASGWVNAKLISYLYGEDFLTSLRHNIQDMFRSKKKYDQVQISCASVNLKVRNGVIETDNGIAVETNAVNMRAAGKVNLGTENLKASINTVPVRGLKISITGNMINSIEFTGNLAEPDIKINGAAVAGKVASATGIGLILAPFTGGIGLVAGAGVGLLAGGLLENWLSDEHPCKTAMEDGAPAKPGDPDWLNQPMATLVGEMIKN